MTVPAEPAGYNLHQSRGEAFGGSVCTGVVADQDSLAPPGLFGALQVRWHAGNYFDIVLVYLVGTARVGNHRCYTVPAVPCDPCSVSPDYWALTANVHIERCPE